MTESIRWQTPPDTPPELSAGAVHLWRMTLSQPENAVTALKNTLSGDERARMARFNEPSARERFAITRGLMRAVLAYHLQISPTDLCFNYLPQGKPELAHPASDIEFNVSHSRELLVCAVTAENRVGVDVEFVRPMRQMDKFAARFFSVDENAWLAEMPEDEKERAFFSIWTGKEAYLKACGDGITRQLRGISVISLPEKLLALSAADDRPADVGQWSLLPFNPADGFLGAVAVEGSPPKLHFWQWDDFMPR